ncbi:MAG: hypothetical protein OSA41_02810 [Erythrobacter sp.]|jgi:hypothetical protein|nr:hypothetical protein [Erythrobacter sp.]
MLIRPSDDELNHVIGAALGKAETYALRDVLSATRAFNRREAVDTLTARIVEAGEAGFDDKTLPLFPETEQVSGCDAQQS